MMVEQEKGESAAGEMAADGLQVPTREESLEFSLKVDRVLRRLDARLLDLDRRDVTSPPPALAPTNTNASESESGDGVTKIEKAERSSSE